MVANQRERIARATAAEIRAHGYSALAVSRITARAGVSRLTFYELFDNKLDCVLTVHRVAVTRLESLITRAYAGTESWADGVVASLATALDYAAKNPDEMHLILVASSSVSEPLIARPGIAVRDRLLTAIRRARGKQDDGPSVFAEQAAIGAAGWVVGGMIQADEAERLPEFNRDLVRLILAPYVGEIEAKRIAHTA